MFEQYSRVRLATSKHEADGAKRGMLGYVIELYPDGNYEVEFSDPATGVTIAQVVVAGADLVAAPELDGDASAKGER